MESSYLDQQRTVKKGIRPLTSSNISKLSKLNLDKNAFKQKLAVSFNNDQINKQLQQQIKEINKCLYNYQDELKQIHKKNVLKGIRQEIFSMEEIIKKKDQLIKFINQQILELKTNASLSNKEEYNNTNLQLNNLKFKLAQQLKFQRQELFNYQQQHKQKLSRLNKIKKAVTIAEDKFMDHCQKTRERPIRYEEFKQLNQQKRKQIQNKSKKINQNSIKKYSSIKQFQNNVQNSHYQKPNNKNVKRSMKDLQNRKVVAEQALKNLKKKHSHQTSQLIAKIQFLRDQDNLLLQTIREKQEQMQLLQTKFNQARGNYRDLGKIGLNDKRQNIMKRQYDSSQNSSRKKQENIKSSRKQNSNEFYQYGY